MRRERVFGCAIAIGLCGAACAAQPTVVSRSALRSYWAGVASGRADIVMIGDSNQLFGGSGWDHGVTRAAAGRLPLYATGLFSAGENQGNGAGVGYRSYNFSTLASGAFAYTGAPAGLAPYLTAPLMQPLGYARVGAGLTVPIGTNHGAVVEADSPLDVNARLRMHLTYGSFALGAGNFRPCIRLQQWPFGNLAVAPVTPSSTGQQGVRSTTLDLPAGQRDAALNFRWAPAVGPEAQPILGPFLAYYTRVENLDRPSGISCHTLYGVGGQSARDMAEALQACPDQYLGLFFSKVRELQGPSPRVLVRINTGLNDRSEPLPSVGPHPQAPGNSAGAFADNLRAIHARVSSVWTQMGWPPEELHFVLTVSHPIDDPDDSQLAAYRGAADALTLELPRTATVRLDRLTTSSEMLANGWYFSETDRYHLAEPGYENLAQREIDALLRCPADFDESGALDVGDFIAFQTAFAIAAPQSDVNDDGALNVGDFIAYQTLFALGCP